MLRAAVSAVGRSEASGSTSKMPVSSRARVYADVLASKPQESWDYDIHEITWGCVQCAECVDAVCTYTLTSK